jgi:hypothetical protein
MWKPELAECSSELFCGSDAGEFSYGRSVNFIICYPKGIVMTERKVDVMDKTGKVLHTYPITLGASTVAAPNDADFEKAALSAAKIAKLVPDSDFASLKTRIHRSTQAAA